jgi:hypothetical protein
MHFLIRKNENLPEDPVGKALYRYFNWEESVKRTVYGLANTLVLLLEFECLRIWVIIYLYYPSSWLVDYNNEIQ